VRGNEFGKQHLINDKRRKELITIPSDSYVMCFFFFRIKKSNQKHWKQTAGYFPFLWRCMKPAGKARKFSSPSPCI